MSLNYRNSINKNDLINQLGTESSLSSLSKNSAKYVRGYANDDTIELLNIFEKPKKELDAYDPYHTSDAKVEDFWLEDGKIIQKTYDPDTNTFKRSLYPMQDNYTNPDFWYEDPFVPKFELSFDDFSPLFNDDITHQNSLYYFLESYKNIDSSGFENRKKMWIEFKNVFFKVFTKDLEKSENRNLKNKYYYITKLTGLEHLNKKFIKYGEDKITITMNEDVSMVAWYIAELYNNLVYSYRNQRYMFPENVIRFDMTIIINEMRNFQSPESDNISSDTNNVNVNYSGKNIKYKMSPKSQIVYTLHDCTFDFFESQNFQNEMEIGGYSASSNITPQQLSFNIFFKSVTRYSEFPLMSNTPAINAWEKEKLFISNDDEPNEGTKQNYLNDLGKIISNKVPEKKGYLNQLLSNGKQTITNRGLNYLDNLEIKLREVRGSAVNGLLSQFNNAIGINKIEPDNVYSADFNNRLSIKNLGKSIGSELLNDLTVTIRDSANF